MKQEMIYTLYLIAIYTFITLNMFIPKAPIFTIPCAVHVYSRSLVTVLLMLEVSLVGKYFVSEYT